VATAQSYKLPDTKKNAIIRACLASSAGKAYFAGGLCALVVAEFA
jgi:hypothetical protein